MNIEFTKRFRKEFHQLANIGNLAVLVNNAIENILTAKTVSEIKNLKKMTGYKDYYRIRVGSYRIGVKIVNSTVIFSVFDHRKDIYKRFP
ncbi:MAG: plasmid stabilization protein [Bacteroidetes bacterium CG_4_10_14_3_um_filter_31_20]|nr:MAG: plasmid stabilization protein [Bacteroidetes bacterium CG_4_10_14_3_um_filter_31_20]